RLEKNYGNGSPKSGVPADHFSASYTTAKKLTAGEYVIRANADDGVRVYIDGKLVLDRWTTSLNQEDAYKVTVKDRNVSNANEKQIHWIEVQYKEITGGSSIDFTIQPYDSIFDVGTWVGEFYTNKNFEGTPYIMGGKNTSQEIANLHFNWGKNSPNISIPSDRFSARFTKKVDVEDGTYIFEAAVDDGIQVYVDGDRIINSWDNNSLEPKKASKYLTAGTHKIVVEYLEEVGDASIDFQFYKFSNSNVFYQYGGNINYNWGLNSPKSGVPTDNFIAYFEQLKWLNSGDYFIRSFADDGIKVDANDKNLINRWGASTNSEDRALWLDVNNGYYTIKTQILELTGNAAAFSDIAPLDTWVGHYYPNKTLSGYPVKSKIINPNGKYKSLVEDNGKGSPISGIASDGFSARYVTAKRIEAGEYVVRSNSDDGIRVLVDGEIVLDRWSDGSNEDAVQITINDQSNKPVNERNIHWIVVEYYENTGDSNVDVSIVPINDVLNTNTWVGYIYPNNNLTGKPVVLGGAGAKRTYQDSDLNFDWGKGSPSSMIPIDNFSAKFMKWYPIQESGLYKISFTADDGVELYIDGEKYIDSWNGKAGTTRTAYVSLEQGYHYIEVRYFEDKSSAYFKLDEFKKLNRETIVNKTNYDISLKDMVEKQLRVSPQTDKKYDVYIRSDALKNVSNNVGTVNGKWYVRGGAGTNYWTIGSLDSGTKVTILSTVKGKADNMDWYKIKFNQTWVNASPKDTEYYINPSNFKQGTTSYYQFLLLSVNANLDPNEVNNNILKGKGILENKAKAFIDAAKKYRVNEIYLISHALLETGNGKSKLATGIKVNGKTVYNMYGIGAYDSDPEKAGAQYAYNAGWFTPEAAIIGGAEFIAKEYISEGQDTLYKMRWNPDKPASHQYASDIGWASKQTTRIANLYSLLDNYTLIFDVPNYK
ncbi:TPA: glucosaminidase domain-containing protein, partial [Yersinia enterocolitica]|nr:glucosaminidase domain-containing protein [Yersinia enterocolitica]